MKCVLIVNSDGMLSALPTVEEFQAKDFFTDGREHGIVEVSEEDAGKVFMAQQERRSVRVLLPNMKLTPVPSALYVAVVNGRVQLI
jgi:hypothetical protein